MESQHVISTRKLVDSDAEQQVLEAMIDKVKPPLPAGMGRLHYLLSTPFRHPPLRWGSRFGSRLERGIWYGSLALDTAFAEVAYYRYVFLEGTSASLTPLTVELSAFKAGVMTRRGVDLQRPPFDGEADLISSPTSYVRSQELGRQMREAGAEAFMYRSARDSAGGSNVGLFVPCFSKSQPRDLKNYLATTTDTAVEILRKDVTARRRDSYRYPRAQFLIGGKLPVVAAG